LATLAGLTLEPSQEQLLSKLSLEYIEMRYPEELATIEELVTVQPTEANHGFPGYHGWYGTA
jgi:hypothetical protein